MSKDRQDWNRKIVDILYTAVMEFPNQRFNQLLFNLDIGHTDSSKEYMEESEHTYIKIGAEYLKLKKGKSK